MALRNVSVRHQVIGGLLVLLVLQFAFLFIYIVRAKLKMFISMDQYEGENNFRSHSPRTESSDKGHIPQVDKKNYFDKFQKNMADDIRGYEGDPLDLDPHEYISVPDKNPINFRCQTCALVSSAGRLLYQESGKEIDNATCVIRMNTSPIQGYERYVGQRTTIRVMSFKAIDFLRTMGYLLHGPGRPKVMVVWAPSILLTVSDDDNMGKGRTYGQLMNIVKNNPDIAVYSLTEREMDFVELLFERETGKSRHGSGSWISTGFYSLVLAFHLCDEIHMYGMVSPQHCQNPQTADNDTIPFHYYDPNGLDECTMYKSQEYKMMGGHRYITEKEVFQKWKERRNITFHYPSW